MSPDQASWKDQLSLRAIIIGCIGCVVITASSAYTALRLGALPWPIVFAAVVSLFFLKLLGSTSLNEANVTHTIMSAGAMVAGGLAFTIPGAWMLGLNEELSLQAIFTCALSGTVLGLICTALIRERFMRNPHMSFPMGTAAAKTLQATQAGGKTGRQLGFSVVLSACYAFIRDGAVLIPSSLPLGSMFGLPLSLYNSPMLAAVGYLVGFAAVAFWLLGGLVANIGIAGIAPALGWWDAAAAQSIISSLGMGLMMGAGIAVVLKDILPHAVRSLRAKKQILSSESLLSGKRSFDLGIFGFCLLSLVVLMSSILGLSPLVSAATIALCFIATIMSAQSCGQTGIDPMEIFGLIVLLIISALTQISELRLFFIAAIVAVACGLAGDVMNDFRAGTILGTDPRAQWIGQALGGILGALVATAVLVALLLAYGPDAFGPGKAFVAVQASVVATMISGIPQPPIFVLGIIVSIVLYYAKLPAMMLGLGVYLPFSMTLTASIGALLSLIHARLRASKASHEQQLEVDPAEHSSAEHSSAKHNSSEHTAPERNASASEEQGLVVASGVLGGESITGVLIALATLVSSLL